MQSITYFEDFEIGQKIDFPAYKITENEIIKFAREYDPAPFHIDPIAAKESIMGEICASGWHTCSILMRLMCQNLFPGGGSLGSPGIRKLRWLSPVFPDDELSTRCSVLSARISNSKPKTGLVEIGTLMKKQTGKSVLKMESTIFFKRRQIDDGAHTTKRNI